ncbi:Translocation protein S66 [Yamadazyma tenuis]|uniref:Translocation protein SEC66 n=1 Tax=Candida tenuis (strain ATCC 10573 / BCRC 21748 / CBS 615 / JCM 9827 / NBRC 10315 / NRRL Y-1498 / VKM Y-70) TaxID=590646 RepID=G3BFC2_CANTC|nr:uncharacterized protein CANTEDRAFT_116042 [Yamadazyma tenuis ATCC 10573]XP_006690200.1 uncharacterized protein CANTEDRAFT_116042 [Yamadazyma tenuis ATCC 10573]EGV60985.1 hypothetical protein CANTEDRAFT_116042 [Yamadazyma tenuis ATCC 10573]EGV60986.1 hypothetical protein CANTEDRAFT_116042 [Yamadazyma tenuis ATCC 10573]WEJ94749.1 Translocation protein S66 [Yamadazyma tenuis]
MDEENPQSQINISVFTPIIYLCILLSCFIAFSVIYRRRRVNNLAKVVPIFEENHSANVYAFLNSQYSDPELPKDQKPHEKVMKAALLRRGVEAIRRSLRLKEAEPVYKTLYQDGLIGDDVFQQFNIQLKLQELEINEIVQQCESFKKNWAQSFFKVAQEICFNEALRRRLYSMSERKVDLSEVWEYYADKSETEVAKKIDSIEPPSGASGVEVSSSKAKKNKNKKKA